MSASEDYVQSQNRYIWFFSADQFSGDSSYYDGYLITLFSNSYSRTFLMAVKTFLSIVSKHKAMKYIKKH